MPLSKKETLVLSILEVGKPLTFDVICDKLNGIVDDISVYFTLKSLVRKKFITRKQSITKMINNKLLRISQYEKQ